MDEPVQEELDKALISQVAKTMGRKGGKKSRRKLTSEQARKMVEARKAKHE